MGMSTNIVGFKPPDEQWKKMKKVYDVCVETGVKIPSEVDDFFEGEPPDDAGVEADIKNFVNEYSNESSNGFEVDITKLPKDIKIIRFYNSW